MRGRLVSQQSRILRDAASRLLRTRYLLMKFIKEPHPEEPAQRCLEGRTKLVLTGETTCQPSFCRRGALGAAQLREVVAAGEEGLDVAGGLAQALAVLDKCDADESFAVLAETDTRRDRDIGAFE